jgi:hypothetical protein
MLRKTELAAAVKLEQAVGQRRYGHFDYDANKAIGPDPLVSPVPRSSSVSSTNSVRANPPARHVDSKTGRITFKAAC